MGWEASRIWALGVSTVLGVGSFWDSEFRCFYGLRLLSSSI